MFHLILTNQHLEKLKRESTQKRVQKRIEREKAIEERKETFSIILSRLQQNIQDEIEGVDGMRVYLNQTQLNIDLNKHAKIYLTCSRTHGNVRAQFSFKNVEIDHAEELVDKLKSSCFGRYRFKVEERQDGIHFMIGGMVPEEEIPVMVRLLIKRFMPIYNTVCNG